MLIEYSENQAQSTSSIKDCIKLLNKLELKILFILDENTKLVGTLTDGDIRRAILNGNELSDSIQKAMNKNFIKYTQGSDLSDIENKVLKDDLVTYENKKKIPYKKIINLCMSERVSRPTQANINPRTTIIIAFKKLPFDENAATAVKPSIIKPK